MTNKILGNLCMMNVHNININKLISYNLYGEIIDRFGKYPDAFTISFSKVIHFLIIGINILY